MLKHIVRGLLMFMPGVALAQVDTTSNLTVVSVYKVALADAIKEEVLPLLETPTFKPPALQYTLQPRKFDVLPAFTPAAALNIASFPQNRLYGNYVRLGFGNYLSPLAEIYLHNLRSNTTSFGFDYRHFSQNGKPDNARFSENSAHLFGTRYYDQGTFEASAGYYRNRYHAYGYDHDLYEFDRDSVKQVFQNIDVHTAYNRKTKNDKQLKWGVALDYYNFSMNSDMKENLFKAYANFDHKINKDRLTGNMGVTYTTVGDTAQYSRTFIDINPRYIIGRKLYDLTIGFNGTYFTDSLKERFYLYPVITGSYQLVPGKLVAYAGFEGGVNRNTLRSFSEENPFIDQHIEIQNAFTNFKFSGGLRGQLSNRFTYNVEISQRRISNLHFYLTDTNVLHKFVTLYEQEANIFNFKAELNYAVNEKIRVAGVLNFYNYKLSDQEQAWQRPNVDFKLSASYNLGNKLYAYFDAFIIGKRYQRVAYVPVTAISMKPITDLNLGVEYRYTRRLSFFVRGNNLMSARYQRWYNYKVYGINALVGLTFTL